jgi:hypothetical protein
LLVSGTATGRRFVLLGASLLVAWILASALPSPTDPSMPLVAPGSAGDSMRRVGRQSTWLQVPVVGVMFLCIGIGLVQSANLLRLQMHPADHVTLYECSQSFRRSLGDGLLVVTGGADTGLHGLLPSAHHAPYFFYWLDRKGFALADSELSLDHLNELRRRGARYFIGETRRTAAKPEFAAQLHAQYELLGACGGAELYRLTPRQSGREQPAPGSP